MSKKIYISGKISGLEREEAERNFAAVERLLISRGLEPINPMKLTPFQADWSWEEYMCSDIRILFGCQGIIMLSNYQDSKGARIELAIAKEMGFEIEYIKDGDSESILDWSIQPQKDVLNYPKELSELPQQTFL